MKKKLFGSLSTVLLSTVLLVGCGGQVTDVPNEEEVDETETLSEEKDITVDISVDGENIEKLSKELSVENDIDVLEIMDMNYDIEATQDGFMEVIEDYEQDESEGLYWMFYINEETSKVGAADYIPEESDQIDWKLESVD